MSDTIIKITGGVIRQQKNTILKDVDVEIKSGEFIYLIGKVGSGKSSLLKTLYAELPLEYGTAEVAGFQLKKIKKSQIPLLRRKCGIVFQDFKLLTDRDVYSNLEFVLRATGWINKKAIRERIETVLEKVDMLEKKHKMPHQLSGGEQQRIVLARALLNAPPIILADEPTGNIDPETSYRLIELLKEICETGKTVIIATHQYDLIEKYPGRVMCCADGKLYERCDTEVDTTVITEISAEDIDLPEITEEIISEETLVCSTDDNTEGEEKENENIAVEEEITVEEEEDIQTEDETLIQEIYIEEKITVEVCETEETTFVAEQTELPFEEKINVEEEINVEEKPTEAETPNGEQNADTAKGEEMASLLGDLSFPEIDTFDYETQNVSAVTPTEQESNTPTATMPEPQTVIQEKGTAKVTKTRTKKVAAPKSGNETKETDKTEASIAAGQDAPPAKPATRKTKKADDNSKPPAFDLELID